MESIKEVLKQVDLIGDTAPEALSGVKTFDPKVDTPLEILKSYESRDYLKCSCGVNKLHKKGLVVRFDNGNCGLIGKDCAEDDFGYAWSTLVKDIVVSHRESNLASKKANQKHGFAKTHVADHLWPDGKKEPQHFYELKINKHVP